MLEHVALEAPDSYSPAGRVTEIDHHDRDTYQHTQRHTASDHRSQDVPCPVPRAACLVSSLSPLLFATLPAHQREAPHCGSFGPLAQLVLPLTVTCGVSPSKRRGVQP